LALPFGIEHPTSTFKSGVSVDPNSWKVAGSCGSGKSAWGNQDGVLVRGEEKWGLGKSAWGIQDGVVVVGAEAKWGGVIGGKEIWLGSAAMEKSACGSQGTVVVGGE
jgi:hypothetical protein